MMKKLSDLVNNIWKKLSQGLLQMFSANVLNKVIGMLGNMVITRMLTKPEYGIWSYVLNIYSYLGLISGFGLLSGAFQFGAENRGKEAEFQYYKFCLKIGAIIDTVLVCIFMAMTCFADFSMLEATPYLRAVAPMVLVEYVLNILLTVLRCENRIKEYARILNMNTVLLVAGTCGGAYFGIGGVVVGKYMAYGCSLIQVALKTKEEVKKICAAENIPWKQTGDLWHYSLFTGTSSALNCLLYLLDISMVAALIGDPVVIAHYKVSTLIPNALSFIPSSVIVCILPNVVLNNKNIPWLRKNIKMAMAGLGMLNLIICAICILFAPYIIAVLSGKQYLDAVAPFRVLMVSYFLSGTFRSLCVNVLAALRCVNYGLFISIMSAISNIIFNYVFIKQYGAIGAAYVTLSVVIVASVLSFGYMLFKLRRGKEPDGNQDSA
uniref:lipopolysaccharide biosynthesis protein n=1 Tax=Agathobacter sp. TaxID=2021311 RepID=UPI0040575628